MNTETGYGRDTDRHLAETAAASASSPPQQEPPPLAVHGDPSQHRSATQGALRSKSGVAWVRPSDLPAMVGSKVIGRGLDLKAELVRRANHPARPKVPRARVTKTAIAEPGLEMGPPSITHTRPGGISR